MGTCLVLVMIYAFVHFCFSRLCGFEPFFDDRGDQYMFKRILNCEYEFVSPWWDNVSLNAKDLVSETLHGSYLELPFFPEYRYI